MNILIILSAAVLFGLPTAVWFWIGARRAQPVAERAAQPHYGGDQPDRREGHGLGTAWARTTTFLK